MGLISWFMAAGLSGNVHGGQMFPIVTNDTAALGFSVACAGTNYLAGIKGDFVTNNEYQITAQLFGPAGTPVGARINPAPGHTEGNGNPLCPFVASSGTNFLMVWPDDYLNGPHSSVTGQIISPSGNLVGGWFALTTNSQQDFTTPEPVAYGDGEYLVVWDDSEMETWPFMANWFRPMAHWWAAIFSFARHLTALRMSKALRLLSMARISSSHGST